MDKISTFNNSNQKYNSFTNKNYIRGQNKENDYTSEKILRKKLSDAINDLDSLKITSNNIKGKVNENMYDSFNHKLKLSNLSPSNSPEKSTVNNNHAINKRIRKRAKSISKINNKSKI
jgi:uncharacterized protein YifE (UPF0438 family)